MACRWRCSDAEIDCSSECYLRAAALCRRPLLADRGRCYDNYDYAFFVGFNGTRKAYEKEEQHDNDDVFDDAFVYPTLGMLIIITMHSHYRQQL